MNPLFDGFSKVNIHSLQERIENHIKYLINNELYPKIINFIQQKIVESVLKGHSIRYITTYINRRSTGIFKEFDIPEIIELDDKEVNIPENIIAKYRSVIIDMFISDYETNKDSLIPFENTYDDKYYVSNDSDKRRYLTTEQYKSKKRYIKDKYDVVECETFTFKFFLDPKTE